VIHCEDTNLAYRRCRNPGALRAGAQGYLLKTFISEETVEVHIKHVMGKLRASDRTHAIAIAARRGFIRL